MSRIVDTSSSPHAKLDSVPLSDVTVDDGFWAPKVKVNRRRSLPHQWSECVRTGRIDNFRVAAGRKAGEITKHLAPDSDVAKWIEAAAYDLNAEPESPVAAELDEVIGLIAAAQDRCGYLDTSFQLQPERWWTNLDHGHELYCGGHLIQAAVACRRATGDDRLLGVVRRWADYVGGIFGPGGRPGTGGHPEVEMALVELYRETGDRSYLELCSFFVEERGNTPPVLNGSPYLQDHLPIREQITPTGHAVRQLYLCSGVTDLYAETGDTSLLAAMEKMWESFTTRRMYVTGGAGARYEGEAFGVDYELPNRTAYSESCAAIASAQWNWRMLLVTGDARYADAMERALYNTVLASVSLDGRTYFYTNPLEHDGGDALAGNRGSNRRTSKHWDHVPCCPPNVARTIASVGGLVYGRTDSALYVHLYVGSSARVETVGTAVEVTQKTDYPWDGRVEVTVSPEKKARFALMLRIPGWARSARVKVNGRKAGARPVPGSYLKIARTWAPGDRVVLDMPMPVERLVSHPRVSSNAGCAALQRGPIVYCIESADHGRADLFGLALPEKADPEAEFRPRLLGGVVVVTAGGFSRPAVPGLFAVRKKAGGRSKKVKLTAVPYFAWANRRPGAMRVWVPTA